MSEALKEFLAAPKTITVPNELPLECLVLYLNLEYEDEVHRAEQLQSLFWRYNDLAYFDLLKSSLFEDKEAASYLEQAQKAAQSGLIEGYEEDLDFERYETESLKIPKFYTVSFIIWAEKAGLNIPHYVWTDLNRKPELYFYTQSQREEEARKFPTIGRAEFELCLTEPLWRMTDAMLYALGHKSNVSEDKKIQFLKHKKRATRLMRYVLDAQKAHDLKLFEFNDHLFDVEQKDKEEKIEKSFYACKVKPKEFAEWLNRLSLDIPVLNQNEQVNLEVFVQDAGYSTLYIDLMIKAIKGLKIDRENQPPKKEIIGWFTKNDDSLSDREKDMMATLVRLPEMKKGGYHKKSHTKIKK